MNAWKLAAPAALAALCVTGIALADNVSVITLENRDPVVRKVDYAIGNDGNCDKNKEYKGTQAIPAKSKWTVKIKGERFCCLRLNGTAVWKKNSLAGGKDYSFFIDL